MVHLCVIFLIAAGLQAADKDADKETALGAQLVQDACRRSKAVENPIIQNFVNKIGGQLALQLPGVQAGYRFTVIAEDPGAPANRTHEPLALPGGYVVIPAPLLLAVQDESEFAGMLAHSMAHIAARHGCVRGGDRRFSSMPSIFIGGWNGARLPEGMRETWRKNELEADRMAMRALEGAGYDPLSLVRYVTRMENPAMPSVPEPTGGMSAVRQELRHVDAVPVRPAPSLRRRERK